jgi:serine/threonine protein phosphatase 1
MRAGRVPLAQHIALSPAMTTWAFSDVHGVRTGLEAALLEAELIDNAGNWAAPPHTQLVGLGDYIDRGADSLGVLQLLWRLEGQAPKFDGRVVLLRGNHEELLTEAVMGDASAWNVWLSDFAGGEAFLRSLGADPANIRAGGPQRLRLALAALAPDLYDRLRGQPEWAIWGDAFLAHAGLSPHADIDQLYAGEDHLWQEPRYERSGDELWNLDGPAYGVARRQGIARVVYGHITQPGEVKLDQDGRALCLDTNAAAINLHDHPGVDGAAVTLARLTSSGSLDASDFVRIDTREATDRAARPAER